MSGSTIELQNESYLNNRYVVQKTLGIGGFGITYMAYDMLSGNVCAIKELYPQGMVTRMCDGVSVCPISEMKNKVFNHSKDRFLEEAEILEKLSNIEEVVKVYDFFAQNGTCYFVMEYLEAISLGHLIKMSKKKMPMEIITDVVKKIGNALMVIHQYNVLHRDISPDNIMVTYDGKVKLIDFGNAKTLSQDENQVFSVVLKPGFAPPEQYSSGKEQGTYTDVYAFASTIYYMLCGEMPPDAMQRQGGINYKPLEEFGVPAYISRAIDNALKLSSAERTQTIYQFLIELGMLGMPQNDTDGQEWLTRRYTDIVSVNSKKKHPYIDIIQTGQAVKRYKLYCNKSVTIGRNSQICDIVVTGDAHISKKHCELIYDENQDLFICMDYSTNGLYVNGQRLQQRQAITLKKDRLVMLGSNMSGFRVGVNYDR